jgi:hypothetical protein
MLAGRLEQHLRDEGISEVRSGAAPPLMPLQKKNKIVKARASSTNGGYDGKKSLPPGERQPLLYHHSLLIPIELVLIIDPEAIEILHPYRSNSHANTR